MPTVVLAATGSFSSSIGRDEMKRYGAKVEGGLVTQVVVVADGADGDATLTALGLVEQPGVRPGIGWSWDGSVFAAPGPSWDDVRLRRDNLLAQSDWTQVGDAPVDAAAWAVYRQQLRDIPQSFDDPADVEWPVPPS